MPDPAHSAKARRRATMTIVDSLNRIHDLMAEDLDCLTSMGVLTYHHDGSYSCDPVVDFGQLSVSVETIRTHRQWATNRIVYDTHDLLPQELATYTIRPFASSLLYQLPHPDPLFVFPQPVPFQGAEGPGYLHALYVLGQVDDQVCSTHDPERNMLRLVGMSLSRDGAVRPYQHPRFEWSITSFHLDTTDETFHADRQLADVDWARGGGMPEVDSNDIRRSTTDLVRIALALLMYACVPDADLVSRRPRAAELKKARLAARRGVEAPAPVVHQLGYVEGPSLAAARVVYEQSRVAGQASTGTGSSKRAHPRRGFMGYRRTGVGRVDRTWTLVRPTYIHRPSTSDVVPTVIDLG